jgi:hypothetical protein
LSGYARAESLDSATSSHQKRPVSGQDSGGSSLCSRRAEKVIVLADHIQLRLEEFFALDGLEDGERAPGDAVMDAGCAPGRHARGEDGERAVWLDAGGYA